MAIGSYGAKLALHACGKRRLRQRSEAAERAVEATRQAEADRLAERRERVKSAIGAIAEIFGMAIPKIA